MNWNNRKLVKKGFVKFKVDSRNNTSTGTRSFRIRVKPNGQSYNDDVIRPDILESSNREDIVKALNKSYNAFRFDYLAGVIVLIALVVLNCLIDDTNIFIELIALICAAVYIKTKWKTTRRQICMIRALKALTVLNCLISFCYNDLKIIALISIVVLIMAAVLDIKRRQINIIYEFEGDSLENYKEIVSAFNKMLKCKKIWAVMSSRPVIDTYESKTHGGAQNIVDQEEISLLGTGKLPWVNTNISIPLIEANGKSIFFVPDGIIIYNTNGITYIEYQNLKITYSTTRFIEEIPPKDAEIVDYTWKVTNIEGGSDMRYKNNNRIPICKYGVLKIESADKVLLHIYTSLTDGTREFKEAMCNS